MTASIFANQSAAALASVTGIKPVGGTFAVNREGMQDQKIKVAVRMRPMPSEAEKTSQKNTKTDKRGWIFDKANNSLIQKGTARRVEGKTCFHFDQIFDEAVQTPLVYQHIARPMVQSILEGKHATIFAYGQTGSGKTYTMQGDGKSGSGQPGIIHMVALDMFALMQMGTMSNRDYVVKISYVEIYNERIRDLLADDICSTGSFGTIETNKTSISSISRQPEVFIRTTGAGDMILDCSRYEAKNVDEVLDLLMTGNAKRVVAKTNMNNYSSRSHAIFRITVESRAKADPNSLDPNEVLRVSDFNLVDLAGSESVKMSNTSGLRQREAAKINRSLLSLTQVIQALSLPKKKQPKHMPYRDSKLTRILQPHLQGNAAIAVLCCASPSKAFSEETRSTLKFAARAKLVQVKPEVNEILDDSATIKKLQRELAETKREIDELKRKTTELAQARPPPQKQPNQKDTISDSEDSKDNFCHEEMETLPNTRSHDARPGSRSAASDSGGHTGPTHSVGGKNDHGSPGARNETTVDRKIDCGSPDARNETLTTEDESYAETVASYSDISMKFGSVVSRPDTLKAQSTSGDRSQHGRLDMAEDPILSRQINDTLSWDTMDLNTTQPRHVGQPIQAMKALYERKVALPEEITIIEAPSMDGKGQMCLTDRLKESLKRTAFLEEKLEMTEDLIEAMSKDLDRARLCIHDLVHRNAQLAAEANGKKRMDIKDVFQKGEEHFEQYWLLKGCMYIGLFSFITGGYEIFMASVFLVWLILEAGIPPELNIS